MNIMNNKTVSVKNLKKYFENVKAVDGISFDVKRGEIFGLLGPNGAGKTTTIKLLLGLLEPNEGNISVLELNPQRDDVQIKKQIGYVSEEPQIFKSLTPRDLFNFIASIRELDETKAEESAKEYLESLEALQYYEQTIATLSHGNKQKVQIIAAILHDPALLILDEPLAGLDAKSVRVLKEVLDLHTESGGSVLFSTHIMEVAEEVCDRIGIIHKGKMVGIGTVEELRRQANKLGASLEDVFLNLTEQDTSVEKIVKQLRDTFKSKRG